ncbi:33966_t:CDS:2 [Racocetra persica]|uniref:33966_t:CDS:1 n=1 Tax=Racocetra persica TaxID=160502 RepID=A0ACA9N740_9GLOM|nr:33966_t:CDS:2 [Racocetra persica]
MSSKESSTAIKTVSNDDANRTYIVATAVRQALSIAGKGQNQKDWEVASKAIMDNQQLTDTERSTILHLLDNKPIATCGAHATSILFGQE